MRVRSGVGVCFVFLHMKSCNENLSGLPVQCIYLLHVITVCFTNKGDSTEKKNNKKIIIIIKIRGRGSKG